MTWAWSGWVVPCWVRSGSVYVFGCLRFCAFPLCVLVGSSESALTKQTRATTTHTHTDTHGESVANTEREDHASCSLGVCARCTPIYSRRSALQTRTLRSASAQAVALWARCCFFSSEFFCAATSKDIHKPQLGEEAPLGVPGHAVHRLNHTISATRSPRRTHYAPKVRHL